jgi:predicted Rossmann fold nucleotide-binding protein DprA/Smf involved in DNA uptake
MPIVITSNQQVVLDAIGDNILDVRDIIKACCFTDAQTFEHLTLLEIKGCVTRHPGCKFSKKATPCNL